MASKSSRSQLKIKNHFSSKVLLYFFVFCLIIRTTFSEYLDCEKDGKFLACQSAPQFLDFLSNKNNFTISVKPPEYTCGTPKSQYLRLGESSPTQLKECDATVAANNHTVEAMVDKEPLDTWWQSVTWPIELYDSTNAFEISIEMSFNKMFQMTGNVEIVFNSGRPRKMVLEKSMDYGATWTPLQYFARNCREYLNQGIAPEANLTKDNPDTVICTQKYSTTVFNPQPGRKVIFAAYDDRLLLLLPQDNNYTAYYNSLERSDLLNFLSFTNLRIRMLQPATDAREISRQPFDFLHYYYAISDIKITAKCSCNLHSSMCIFENGQKKCQCEHFTEGRDCERCLPLYNNKPWRPGSFSPYPTGTANQCEKCECNDHAESCTYNQTLGQGVCDNCTHNTTGYNCEKCLPAFFPDVNLPLNDSNRCIECSCEPLGVENINSSCIQESNPLLGQEPGQCKCKPLVTGRRCDRCEPEYYGLLVGETNGTCKMCSCNTDGTVNKSNVCDQSDGQCICKESTESRKCDVCKDGYYQFPTLNPAQECLKCGCDSGLSKNKTCNRVSGVCECKDHVTGDKCTVIETNYYVPALDEFRLQPEGGQAADCSLADDLWTSENPFDGNEFALCPLGKDTTLNFQKILGDKRQMNVIWWYHPAIRYTLNTTNGISGAQVVLTVDGASDVDVSSMQTEKGIALDNKCPDLSGTKTQVPIDLPPGTSTGVVALNLTVSVDLRCKYTLSLMFTGIQNSTDSIMVDSAIMIPALAGMNGSQILASFRQYEESTKKEELMNTYQTCVGKLAGLLTRESALTTEPCKSLMRSIGGDLHDGPQLCQCDPTGTVVNTACSNIGGQCVCKPGVGDRKCDRCLSGYFNFTVDGCQPCNCESRGSMYGACDRNNGQCPCKNNVALSGQKDTTNATSSRYCSACLENFYGYGAVEGCLPCDCNQNGSTADQCASNGQCPCKDTIGGRTCDICETKFYKFSPDGCISCNCSSEGSTTGGCNIDTGICDCKENVEGEKCDQCKSGFFNLEENNPKGCQPCFCYGHGTGCTSAAGYSMRKITVSGSETLAPSNGLFKAPVSFLNDQHWSYGRTLSFMIKTNGATEDLKNVPLVRFENEDKSVTYYHKESFSVNETDQMFTVPLYEWNWVYNESEATADEFYGVLSSVSNLYISQFINSTELSISQLTLVSAQKVSGDGDVSYVENCTCEVSRFVRGTSCESCAEGYRRPNYQNDTSYSTCLACNCSSRGMTNPPQCDEWSGVCLNCKNGTTGEQCESCAANVTEPDCTTCMDGFYGLNKDGCKACECDKVGSTSNVCNKDTGQCSCAEFVTGRQCNQCQDNYYNLQSTGCTVCNDCYGLVMQEVEQLRLYRDNLTTEIERLQANDVTQTLGGFESRLTKTKADRDTLLTYLSSADTVQSENQQKTNEFKSHIEDLTTKVNTVKTGSKPEIEKTLIEGDAILQQALDNKQRVDITIKDIKTLTEPISQTVSKLEEVAGSIESSESTLVNMTSSASSGLTAILQTIETLENITSTANIQATQVLEKVQSDLTVHQENIGKISNLKKQHELVTSSGETAIAEARDARTTSNTTYHTALKLTEELTDLEAYNPDISTQTNKIQSLKQQAETLKTQVATEQTNINTKLTSISDAVTLGNKLLLETRTLLSSVEELYTKVSNALKVANTAKTTETTVFDEATNMLETMKNFDARRKVVETAANESLAAVNRVKIVSEEVISEAGNLRTSLTTAQQNSVLAKEAARQAYTIAQQQNTELAPIGGEASRILNKADAQLSDLESKASAPVTINTTIVIPASTTCDSFKTSLTNLQTKASTVNSKAQNLTGTAMDSKKRADLLIQEINKIGEVDYTGDTDRLTRLKNDVQAARDAFNNLNLTTTLTNLKSAVATQKTWLENFQIEKANLQKQIDYLKRIQVQVN